MVPIPKRPQVSSQRMPAADLAEVEVLDAGDTDEGDEEQPVGESGFLRRQGRCGGHALNRTRPHPLGFPAPAPARGWSRDLRARRAS